MARFGLLEADDETPKLVLKSNDLTLIAGDNREVRREGEILNVAEQIKPLRKIRLDQREKMMLA